MKKDVKEKWLIALRSGEYEQGKGELRSDSDAFCCLGVLADLYSKDQGVTWEPGNRDYEIDGSRTEPGPNVLEWAGLTDCDPKVIVDGERKSLMFANDDGGKSFVEIADLIEAQL